MFVQATGSITCNQTLRIVRSKEKKLIIIFIELTKGWLEKSGKSSSGRVCRWKLDMNQAHFLCSFSLRKVRWMQRSSSFGAGHDQTQPTGEKKKRCPIGWPFEQRAKIKNADLSSALVVLRNAGWSWESERVLKGAGQQWDKVSWSSGLSSNTPLQTSPLLRIQCVYLANVKFSLSHSRLHSTIWDTDTFGVKLDWRIRAWLVRPLQQCLPFSTTMRIWFTKKDLLSMHRHLWKSIFENDPFIGFANDIGINRFVHLWIMNYVFWFVLDFMLECFFQS